jgi:hypothetical protein
LPDTRPTLDGVGRAQALAVSLLVLAAPLEGAEALARAVTRFPLASSGLELRRPALRGRFFDVLGRRAAVFGREGVGFEAWAYPLKLVDDFRLSFRLHDYPLDIEGNDVLAQIEVRPEGHDLHVLARSLHRPSDPVRAGGRARCRDAARRLERAAAHDHRLLPPAAAPDVARGPDDRLGRLGRGRARLLPDRRDAAVRRRRGPRRKPATYP